MKKTDFDKIPVNVTEIILESISDGVFTVDHKWRIMSFNHAAEEITGVSRDEAIGRHCWEVFRSNMCESDCALKRTMKEGKSLVSSETYIINSEKKRIPITVSTCLLKDEKGEILGGVETFRDHSLVEELRKELNSRFKLGDIVSCSESMQQIFNILPRVAESDSTVLIEGETGTGKELLARAIHNSSLRKEKSFIAINCGALPDTLLESELFGYKAGAFTNATKDKPGYFAIAEGGTIFLDEIGDTSSAFQTRLLRVIEAQEFQPLGAVKKVKTNVRIIAATNKNLAEQVAMGKFRKDLFYRINIISLTLPRLRDRSEDISLLINHFISKMNLKQGKSVSGIEPKALAILMGHDYPGNIRELENIIERAFVLCTNGNLKVNHLPGNLVHPGFIADNEQNSLNIMVKSAEAAAIIKALQHNSYNRSAAARELGMHKSTLFRKIKKLGISLPEIDGRSRLKK